MIERRTFLAGTGAVLVAGPRTAEGQPAVRLYRMGSIVEEMPTVPPGRGLFWERMKELGWDYGRDVVVERRAYGSQAERIPELATELMRSGVDVFIVSGGAQAVRLVQVTRTIPIVASNAAVSLVQLGLAASLARPGGNVTGTHCLSTDVVGKQFAFLKEVIPGFSRSAFLAAIPPDLSEVESEKALAHTLNEALASVKLLGIHLQIERVRRAEDLDVAFSAFRDRRTQGILLVRTPLIFIQRKVIAGLALKHRLPTIADIPEFPVDGGLLLSYGYDPREPLRLSAGTVDKILRGVKAAEIPIQQATMFRLIINLKTAKALGLTIPQSLLLQADEVLQ